MTMRAALVVLAACAVAPALAAEPKVQVEHAWVRPASAGQPGVPLFADIASDAPVKLVGARTAAAKEAVLMSTEIASSGESVVKRASGFDVAAGTPLRLAPRGPFVQLRDVKQLLRTGDSVPFTLEFRTADGKPFAVDAQATVRGIMPRPDDYDATPPAGEAAPAASAAKK